MIRRKQFGQHFLNSNSIAKSIVSEANITKNDVVYEIGTGLGVLTPLLCQQADKVISVDIDESLVKKAKQTFSNIDNLVLKSGDGFKKKDTFSIFVSNLPYSKSKDAIEWLAQTSFSHGVIMVQKEFAEKLLATASKKRKAISVIATHAFDITLVSKVGKNNFSPPPKIDSVILKIIKKNNMTKDLVQTINRIFSYRRKTVKNVLKQFNKETSLDKRVDDLSGDEIINLANKILE
ncbi:16S rRNA (adenine(1518)-N(6)/adenine(1519)-N(6))-dimethyltransferase RsmA [Nitrosopumilus sp.]|uniref:16S rRNA (adenine(1518)-N(6)/adenine(1519)-N(6))- dimethyltransferase RsmA n=1 Tax=Nitrosopumilus sp. TaxID=2024843 RepID=UPI0034A08A31